jgi:uncharacterized protein
VKVVTDAYNGTMTFYVADAADPVIRSYEAAFPSLFRPMSEMPAALRTHIRYPEGLFTVQAGIYRSYHVTDPTVLFQQSDRWEVPMEPQQVSPVASVPSPDNSFPEAMQPQANSQLPMEPFYVTMRLPEGQGEEFVLMLPFEISRPPSMPAWLCARCDGDEYGHLRAYVFPPGVDGPQQVESYIDQNPDVSAKLSLWGQKGSKVIRGNLLALLLDQSILYVEPIFLSATANNLPRLTQVILVNSGRVVMRATLGEALQALIGGEAAGTESAAAGPARGVAPPGAPAAAGTVQAIVARANQAFNAATEAQRRGDWAAYGTELRRLQQALAELTQRTGIAKK